jgi:hypothetical protein
MSLEHFSNKRLLSISSLTKKKNVASIAENDPNTPKNAWCLGNGLGVSHSILCLPLRQAIHHRNLTSESQRSHITKNPTFQRAQNEPLRFNPV